jgi:hypothetical protein
VTPRQACPQPEGVGRNLRSKTRWFTGFCNSHQVSHFATFFIDARAEISVAESRYDFQDTLHPHSRSADGDCRGNDSVFCFPWRWPRRGSLALGVQAPGRHGDPLGQTNPSHRGAVHVKHVFAGLLFRFDNDPSAGSPTETLLRLLLPLNDKVQWTSRDVAGSEPPTSPRSEHFTGPFNR